MSLQIMWRKPSTESAWLRGILFGRLVFLTCQMTLAHLRRMFDYITKQESDARGWIKDSEQLKAALGALHERKETVQRLVSVLVEMQQPEKGSAL